ncbi:Glycerophosphoryl diester phosphodiesterase [Planctomycetales bacterium 10988]|nr:Glycerophosphoryl diester phosphodiesterase [Planctomycetales bacterium 10988]
MADPLIVCHRGFSSLAPENTLAAYRLAWERGFSFAECDVRLTRDRVPVLIHDAALKRTAGKDSKLSDLTYQDLQEFEVGGWKDEQYRGEPVSRLVDVLKYLRGKMRLIIEIKETGMEKEVLEAISTAGYEPGEVTVFAFDLSVLLTLRTLEPCLPSVWLQSDWPHDPEVHRERWRTLLSAGIGGIGFSTKTANAASIHASQARNLRVYVWTANTIEQMKPLLTWGVDAIMTDYPERLQKLVNERGG